MSRTKLLKMVRGNLNGFHQDRRGVSITIDHALGLMILLVLTGVFVGSVSNTYDGRENAVTEQELDRISNEVAAGLLDADTLVETAETRQASTSDSGAIDASTRITLPSSVAGNEYTVTIAESDGNGNVVVTARSGDSIARTTVQLSTTVEAGGGSGDLVIEYDSGVLNVVNP